MQKTEGTQKQNSTELWGGAKNLNFEVEAGMRSLGSSNVVPVPKAKVTPLLRGQRALPGTPRLKDTEA
jgi:hypothetical protein